MLFLSIHFFYKFSSHFFPGLVYSQAKKPPATTIPTIKVALNVFITLLLSYFKILFPTAAKMKVRIEPGPMINQFVVISVSVYKGVMFIIVSGKINENN